MSSCAQIPTLAQHNLSSAHLSFSTPDSLQRTTPADNSILPHSEGLAAFNILQERGIPSRFLTFPDESHWVLNEENSLVWHTVVLNWINKHVGLPLYKEDGEEACLVQSRPLAAD